MWPPRGVMAAPGTQSYYIIHLLALTKITLEAIPAGRNWAGGDPKVSCKAFLHLPLLGTGFSGTALFLKEVLENGNLGDNLHVMYS